jgi:hypothetical protein
MRCPKDLGEVMVIAHAAARGHTDLSLVSVDASVSRAHHDVVGMVADEQIFETRGPSAAELSWNRWLSAIRGGSGARHEG